MSERVEVTFRQPAGMALWRIAHTEAEHLYHEYIGVEHVLIALSRAAEGYTERMLSRLHREPEYLRAELRARAGVGSPGAMSGETPTPTPRLRRALTTAQERAGAEGLGEKELLLAVLTAGPGVAVRVLTDDGRDIEEVVAQVENDPGPETTVLRIHAHAALEEARNERAARAHQDDHVASETPLLDRFGQDLTAEARAGKLREVVGRQRELAEIASALVRQERNVPVLVGEAGVGKTAIVEGFAARLALEDERPVKPELRGQRIIALQAASLVAGTKYHGEFEERVQAIMRECAEHPEVILFIDEIHTLVGAGHGDSSQDIAQLFKPALSSGRLRVIGATTHAEFQRSIARDPALERRMQVVRVEEISAEETKDLLRALAPRFEQYHHARIEPAALDAAVDFAVRYLTEQRLPAKAIDLLDDACARVVVRGRLSFIDGLDDEDDSERVITPALVTTVVAERLGIPVAEVSMSDRVRLLTLEQTLGRYVVAQDQALNALAQALKILPDLRDPDRPRGVLFFAGPTGVGKTETARALATILFGNTRTQPLLRLDMAEYGQEYMVAQLIGSPPGYKGYGDGGRLTDWLRRQPYSVVLFDEVEKAHPHVLSILLGLFEEGRLTDGTGRTVNGREAIYILTSNLLTTPTAEGYDAPSDAEPLLRQRLGSLLSPELVNRLDHIIVFRTLDHSALETIAQMHINRIGDRLERRGVRLHTTAEARAWLVDHGSDAVSGARGLARIIQSAVLAPISEFDLQGRLSSGATIEISAPDSSLAVHIRDEAMG
ncbi:MAG TPA: ATP-dependent Clp protease ATP-binding subunit [Ktedonobacterales bacterium]